jgi:HK97 family phage portal protein
VANKSLVEVLYRGLTTRNGSGTKSTWRRPASVPDNAGDGFTYNAPWRVFSDSGRPLSERTILQLSAVMACVRLLSQTIATLPFGMYKRLPDGDRVEANNHTLYELLHNQPNADMTAVDFWQMILAWLLLRGVGYAEMDMIGGQLVALDPLYVPNVSWVDNSGVRTYTYVDPETRKSRKIPSERMWKLIAFTLNGRDGISPIRYGARVFGSAISAEDASEALFANGLSASGFVTTQPGQWLKPDQREKMREHLDEFAYSAANARKSFILEGGMDYKPLSLNPEDAQMLETRSYGVEEICRWYGVDPTLIGHGEKASNWGTGLEQRNISFLTYCLTPYLRKIEQSVRKNLIPAAQKSKFFGEFNAAALMRGDTASRFTSYSTAVNNGFMTRDEVRQRENLPSKGGNAEVLTVQTALAPLDKLGQIPAAPATETPPTAPASEEQA